MENPVFVEDEMSEIVVFITASNEDEAEEIAHALVETRLAACVNIVKGIRSVYRWKGKVEDDSEVLMIVKTQRSLFEQLANKVIEYHSYSVPEIIALPIVEGLENYMKWLREETG
jgi:periplasmic divalent cation tolerance protein